MAVCTRKRRLDAGMLSTVFVTDWRMSSDIVPCKRSWLKASTTPLGSLATESQGERSTDVPLGRFGGAADMVEKITLLTKLSRLKEVRDENSTNCGPSTLSPGTLAPGG